MSRLGPLFETLRARGEPALVPFVTAGDPDLDTTAALVPALVEAGADAVEIGVPFSDPVGDGPSIQKSSERALASGATLRRVLELVKQLRQRVETPLVLMGYANSFLTMGAGNFAEAAAEVGTDGVICVDMPPEEGGDYWEELIGRGVDPILLATPTTRPERLAMLAARTRGFLYYVSVTGVTGARQSLALGIEEQVARVRETSKIPVCVGFGVSTPEHARQVGSFADGVVVGSALVERIDAAPDPDAAVEAAATFVGELKAALR